MASKKKLQLQTHEEFLETAEKHSKLFREVQFAETSMNEEMDSIKKKYADQIKTQSAELKATSILLEDYALQNVDALTTKDKRTFETATMTFSFYKAITYPQTAKLIELLKKFKKFVTVKETVNRNDIKDLETEEVRKIGLAVEENVEHLTMRVKTEEIA